ncbi:MAG: DUF61 family protein [Candidatus Thermoplasmatota archaeon]|nr:DUF61 family protein [Candidatus Thermoplasmatota archaeon]
MFDEDKLKKWFQLEGHRVNDALVTRRVPLTELLEMEAPQATTRSGGVHTFDAQALARMAEGLSSLARGQLKLPIHIYEHHEQPTDCYVSDEGAIRALTQLGEVDREPREGKLWMSRPLARELAGRWPTLIQFVRY